MRPGNGHWIPKTDVGNEKLPPRGTGDTVGLRALVSGILLLPFVLYGNLNIKIPTTAGWFSVPR
jgi:hypothetical protein